MSDEDKRDFKTSDFGALDIVMAELQIMAEDMVENWLEVYSEMCSNLECEFEWLKTSDFTACPRCELRELKALREEGAD